MYVYQVHLALCENMQINLPLYFHVNSQCQISLSPWYEYSGIGKSNIVPVTLNGAYSGKVGDEPESTANQYGFDIGVKYNF